MAKQKLISVVDFVSAYKAYVDVVIYGSASVCEKTSTEKGITYLNMLNYGKFPVR